MRHFSDALRARGMTVHIRAGVELQLLGDTHFFCSKADFARRAARENLDAL